MTEKNSNILYTSPVDEMASGQRLDKYIADNFPDFSRAQAQRLIEEACVFIQDVPVTDKNYKTRIGELYRVYIPPLKEAIPLAENIPLDILYEDSDVIVVNKPAGMTVHPAAGVSSGTLVNALLYHCHGSLSGIGGVARPGIVHRIDRNTSGILVVAKNDTAHRFLAEQFSFHSVERTYYAVVYGVPKPSSGTICGNIARSPYDRKKMAIVSSGGKKAVTHYSIVEQYKNAAALVECHLETGRTHQIRVHLSSIGCHLIGDDVYVQTKKTSVSLPLKIKLYVNSFPRQALHAYSLGFVHPRTHQFMSFSSDFPEDMKELINTLKQI